MSSSMSARSCARSVDMANTLDVVQREMLSSSHGKRLSTVQSFTDHIHITYQTSSNRLSTINNSNSTRRITHCNMGFIHLSSRATRSNLSSDLMLSHLGILDLIKPTAILFLQDFSKSNSWSKGSS